MPIRIRCPKCKTALAVKDALAGKRANCPKCRYVLSIPTPKARFAEPEGPPREDAEALALSAFADEPPKKQAAVAKQIEFECPWCMEMVKVGAEHSGKQTPCPNPECKRIVKVPLLKEDKPKDWRQVDPRAPAGLLKRDGEQEPEGAWSTAQKSRVSTESLIEADAIPVKKIPLTTANWIRRGVLAFVATGALVGGTWGIIAWSSSSRLDVALKAALDQVPNMKPVPAADILRGSGEFHLMRKQADKAKKQFNSAFGKIIELPDDKAKPDAGRDTVLIELALAWIDLAGSSKEAEEEGRVSWEDMPNELRRTLEKLTSVDAKQTALRAIGSKLIAKNQPEMARGIASALAEPVMAPVPEKKLPAPDGNKEQKPPPVIRSPLDAQVIALLIGTGNGADAKQVRPAPGEKDKDKEKDKEEEMDPIARFGYAEGKARQGEFDAARKLAKAPGPLLHRLEASIGVAAVALGDKKMAQAKENAQDALDAYSQLQKTEIKVPVWLLIQLTRVCAQAGLASEAKQVAKGLPDAQEKEAKALAQLELVLAQLEISAVPVAVTVIDEAIANKETLGYSLALEKVARHNTRLGADTSAMLEGLDDNQKAFVRIGIALGLVDARK